MNHMRIYDQLGLEKTELDHKVIDEPEFENSLFNNALDLAQWKKRTIDGKPNDKSGLYNYQLARDRLTGYIAGIPSSHRNAFQMRLFSNQFIATELDLQSIPLANQPEPSTFPPFIPQPPPSK
jgi:hypothetical protein